MEFRKLRADEIDCRIARVNGSSVQLLLYKDARCDMNILDETVGPMNWMRSHARENANCIVSIWDEGKKQWVSKEDTGTESNTEKEKGLASDSFKRACFNWGIGRELYTAPNIFFRRGDCNVDDKNKCHDSFAVKAIEYEGNVISRLTILNEKTGKEYCFTAGGKGQGMEGHGAQDGGQYEKVPEDMAREFLGEVERTGVSLDYFLSIGGVGRVEDLRKLDVEAAIKALRRKPDRKRGG